MGTVRNNPSWTYMYNFASSLHVAERKRWYWGNSVGCLWQTTVSFRQDFFFFVHPKWQIWLTAETIFISEHFAILRVSIGLLFSSIVRFWQGKFCDSGKENSAILAKRRNKQKVRHFRRYFDIVYRIEHHPFRVTHRTNEFTVHSACQTNQRVQQPNLRVHPAYVPNA